MLKIKRVFDLFLVLLSLPYTSNLFIVDAINITQLNIPILLSISSASSNIKYLIYINLDQ